jgi:hypothetical protein
MKKSARQATLGSFVTIDEEKKLVCSPLMVVNCLSRSQRGVNRNDEMEADFSKVKGSRYTENPKWLE